MVRARGKARAKGSVSRKNVSVKKAKKTASKVSAQAKKAKAVGKARAKGVVIVPENVTAQVVELKKVPGNLLNSGSFSFKENAKVFIRLCVFYIPNTGHGKTQKLTLYGRLNPCPPTINHNTRFTIHPLGITGVVALG